MGGIESDLVFQTYKIDSFNFEMHKSLDNLLFVGSIDQKSWSIDLKMNPPNYFKAKSIYHVSFECLCAVKVKDAQQVEVDAIKLNLSISGAFSSTGRLESSLEEKLIKFQAPAILMSYARAGITSFVSSAGFGTFVFPLINMNNVAQQGLKDIAINVVE